MLVVTKADLGAVARRAEHDLRAALGALGAARHAGARGLLAPPGRRDRRAGRRARQRTAPRSTSPPPAPASRRLGALADFLHEHGERGLRALGGRRAARRWLEEQPPGLDEPELLRRLEHRTR